MGNVSTWVMVLNKKMVNLNCERALHTSNSKKGEVLFLRKRASNARRFANKEKKISKGKEGENKKENS